MAKGDGRRQDVKGTWHTIESMHRGRGIIAAYQLRHRRLTQRPQVHHGPVRPISVLSASYWRCRTIVDCVEVAKRPIDALEDAKDVEDGIQLPFRATRQQSRVLFRINPRFLTLSIPLQHLFMR